MARVILKDLTKQFGENTVVNQLNLTVENGTLVSILGPSGCGKTTTLRMIAGFEKADGGDIFFDEQSITGVSVHKRNIGMVFQSYALFPHMTVFQNIAYGLEQRGLKKDEIEKKVMQAMQMVHMEEYRNRKPKQLSGGQQQRVALARALVIEPSVLLLDECLSALDKKLRVEMQIELRKILEQSHVTTFFVTHDQEEAMTLSDVIVVMNNGKIEQAGTPFDVYEHPKNKFVADFLGKANFIEGKVQEVDGNKITLEKAGSNEVFHFEAAQTVEVGQTVVYGIRPEKMILSKEKKNGFLEGKVSFITYSGNITRFNIDCQGQQYISEQQNSMLGESIRIGDTVQLFWKKESCILLEQ